MHLSELGSVIDHAISNVGAHHSNVEIPLWCVMPDHVHAIVIVNNSVPHLYKSPIGNVINERKFITKNMIRETLSVVIGGIKAAVTRYANKVGIEFAWQPRFHDRIIRDMSELKSYENYITGNPAMVKRRNRQI